MASGQQRLVFRRQQVVTCVPLENTALWEAQHQHPAPQELICPTKVRIPHLNVSVASKASTVEVSILERPAVLALLATFAKLAPRLQPK
jgi:hypothetical protein